MTSSYYPITTNKQSQSIPSYQVSKTSNKNYTDDDDDDLDELRKAALKTLNSKKRKNNYDHSPVHRNSRSTSRTYSSSSQSSYSHSSISRSRSSSSLSSISSNSLDKNDKDYRFETKEKQANGDIDERFPQDIPNDGDMLILDCPIQDDDLLKDEEQKKSDQNKRNHSKPSSSKAVKSKKEEPKKLSPSIERPVSITVKLNSDEFDLRNLIKKRRTDESSGTNQRVVQILPKTVDKTVHDRESSRRSDKKYHKH